MKSGGDMYMHAVHYVLHILLPPPPARPAPYPRVPYPLPPQ